MPVAPPRPSAEPEVEERRGARTRGARLTEETGALGRREALAVGERRRPAVQVPAAQIGHATRSTVDRREPDVRAEHHSARAGDRPGADQLVADRSRDSGERPHRHDRREGEPDVAEQRRQGHERAREREPHRPTAVAIETAHGGVQAAGREHDEGRLG